MANDLVVQSGWSKDEELDEWDRPPIADIPHFHPYHPERAARSADRDALSHAEGDGSFASQRVTDARENRQRNGDWGDLRTWISIACMCLGFLAVTAAVYFLPNGRHNQNDGATPTPSIRPY